MNEHAAYCFMCSRRIDPLRDRAEHATGIDKTGAFSATLCGDMECRRQFVSLFSANGHRVRIFSEGDFHDGTLTWGWECLSCQEEEGGFGTATRAQEYADSHEALA